jgi:hypothetical protein
MVDRFGIGSAFRWVVLMAAAVVALPACVDDTADDDDDSEVEATGDALIAPAEGGTGNMLTNPGFETAFSSTDWWLGNTWESTSGRAFRSTVARHSGSYGLRLNGFAFLIHKDVATKAGARYTIAASARRTASGTTPCWMEVQFYPSGGVYKTAKVSSATDWKTYAVTVVAPSGTTSARVQVKRDPEPYASTVDACDWDDFSFRRVY